MGANGHIDPADRMLFRGSYRDGEQTSWFLPHGEYLHHSEVVMSVPSPMRDTPKAFFPRSREEGAAAIHWLCGHTVMALWEDVKDACTFVLKGLHSFDEMLEHAGEQHPKILQRFYSRRVIAHVIEPEGVSSRMKPKNGHGEA